MQIKRAFDKCNKCGIELKRFNKRRNTFYSIKTKYGLCRKCVAKLVYSKRGAFTNNNKGKIWNEKEINLLKKEYPTKTCEEIGLILNRLPSSIQHKANRLNLYKSDKFWKEHPVIINKLFKSNNNPMSNFDIRKKVSEKLKKGFKEGKIKLAGIALKSKMGLTKKENHPNWLGGKSFEPYDIKFNKLFHKAIILRDNFICMVCNKDNSDEISDIEHNLCVHHIDYNKKNTCEENCIALCNSCHAKTNYNRSSWIKFFQTLMSDRYGYDY